MLRTDAHVVERDADVVAKLVAKDGDFGVALAEVRQQREFGAHQPPHFDGLRRGAVRLEQRFLLHAVC